MKLGVRIATRSLAAAAILVCAACSAPATPSASTAGASTTAAAIQVEQGVATVNVTIRRDLMDADRKKTDTQIIEDARSKGMVAVVNPNSTITYTMTKGKQQEMLAHLATSFKEADDKLIAEKKTSITAVENASDFTKITAKVDGSRYKPLDSLYILVFYLQGGLYQQFAGVPGDQVDVQVEFVDDKTGAVLNKGSYKDWMQRMSSASPTPGATP